MTILEYIQTDGEFSFWNPVVPYEAAMASFFD
jgi:hypothetical protein